MKEDGTVWAWGAHWYGGLGDGTTTLTSTPIQVSGLNGVVAVSGGGFFSLALRSDGTVWAWGATDYGQLGEGTRIHRSTPIQLAGLTKVVAINAGYAVIRASAVAVLRSHAGRN